MPRTSSALARARSCGKEYTISGAALAPGAETEAPARFFCECGGFVRGLPARQREPRARGGHGPGGGSPGLTRPAPFGTTAPTGNRISAA